jgi:hypothetical protein
VRADGGQRGDPPPPIRLPAGGVGLGRPPRSRGLSPAGARPGDRSSTGSTRPWTGSARSTSTTSSR